MELDPRVRAAADSALAAGTITAAEWLAIVTTKA